MSISRVDINNFCVGVARAVTRINLGNRKGCPYVGRFTFNRKSKLTKS